MSSSDITAGSGARSLRRALVRSLLLATLAFVLVAGSRADGPKFYPDDPIAVDNDKQHDAGDLKEVDLSEIYDFATNTFGSPGDRSQIRALNANTMDEVPESSWFTNRIGRRAMSIEEIVRGPDKFEKLEPDEWLVVRGKGPGGFQPGFRAVDPQNPNQIYQLEVDPPSNPEMATGAEMIGTTLYHAIGFNVVDVYIVHVDPNKIRISDQATIRDARGRRPFVQDDLDGVFKLAAREADGRYRMLASRFVEGRDLGNFQYHGMRTDDPNDVFPHEHRRELRANRVFCAWVNHDDSRAINSLNMLVDEGGRKFVRHYMFDFGSILGSATRFADSPRSGHEYLLEKGSSLAALFSLGLYVRPWLLTDYPKVPPSVGRVEADSFEPEKWKAEYPNAAFQNMRADDALWGARIVASFSDEAIRAAVGKARYSDPRATDYLTGVLIKRRDKIAQVWLNGVNPIVNPALSSDGRLTFENAAVAARAATPAASYRVSWSRFDNASGKHDAVGGEMTVTDLSASAPPEVLRGSDYISVTIRGEHPEHPAWAKPTQVYFRRGGAGWTAVGLERQ